MKCGYHDVVRISNYTKLEIRIENVGPQILFDIRGTLMVVPFLYLGIASTPYNPVFRHGLLYGIFKCICAFFRRIYTELAKKRFYRAACDLEVFQIDELVYMRYDNHFPFILIIIIIILIIIIIIIIIKIISMRQIADLKHVADALTKEGMDICVVSYGGSGSNTLVDALTSNGYRCRTPLWDRILCHCPVYIDLPVPIIYIYRNPVEAFLSVRRRFFKINQQKLANDMDVFVHDENLLRLMIRQFLSFTSNPNVLVLKYDELFQPHIVQTLEGFLSAGLRHFPIPFIPPVSAAPVRDKKKESLSALFYKYRKEIQYINGFYRQKKHITNS